MGWRHLFGKEFPLLVDEELRQGPPLTPAALNRRLVRARRADIRAAGNGKAQEKARWMAAADAGPAVCSPVLAPRTTALLMSLPPAERRRIAVLLQEERFGLEYRDMEALVGAVLAGLPCGWTLPEVRRLFERTLQPGRFQRTVQWGDGAERALQIPLGATAQLSRDDRTQLTPYLRRALALARGHQGPAGRAARESVAAAAYPLLDLSADVEEVLPPDRSAYARSARCALGAAFYHPDVIALLRLAARPVGVRPDYPWLGSVHELLTQARRAREALPVLFNTAAGRACCASGRPGAEPLGAEDARLLGALAWAACVAGHQRALNALAGALHQHALLPRTEVPLSQEEFLRSGLAALSALAGRPEPGAHHRVLPQDHPAEARWAGRKLDELRQLPNLLDTDSFTHPIGGCTAVFTVRGDGQVLLRFRNARGRLLPKAPHRVRREALAYAALRARLTELRDHVTAHRGTLTERLTADLGLPAGAWWTSQLDDPALAPLTRALIWQADTPRGTVVGMPVRRKGSASWMLRDISGGFHELTEDTPIRLWNPHVADAAEIAPWRTELTRRHVLQPIPQLPPRP